mgnify:CR=1 FL=1
MRKSTFGLLMIDTADILASADGEEARWEAITRVARMVGANAVTAGTFRWDTKEPDYVRSSMDPLWIERYADRITTAHVKDIAPEGEKTDEDGWADVGHGTMHWKTIHEALVKAGVDLFVMEHDKPADVKRFATRSIETFKTF